MVCASWNMTVKSVQPSFYAIIENSVNADLTAPWAVTSIFTLQQNLLKRPISKRPKIGFQDQLSCYAGQKYCRMLQGEHSTILLTFIKLPFVIKIFILSIFEWPFYTGFTVFAYTP